MIITCENCSTGVNLAEELLNPSGSKVRCSKCGHVFTAYPPNAPPLPEPASTTELQDFDIFPDDFPSTSGEDFQTTSLPESKQAASKAETPPTADETADLGDMDSLDDLGDLGDLDDLDGLDSMLDDLEQTLDEHVSEYPESPSSQDDTAGDDLEDIDNLLEMDEDSLDEILAIPIADATVPAVDETPSDGEDTSPALDFELDALDDILDDESKRRCHQGNKTCYEQKLLVATILSVRCFVSHRVLPVYLLGSRPTRALLGLFTKKTTLPP